MSEKGIKVLDADTGEVVACRDAVETDESSNARIIQRVDVSKGKLWASARSATPTASVETGDVSLNAADSTIADNALTVGDASTLVVIPEFSYNFTQSADITPVILAKNTDDVVGVLETKTVSMTKNTTPYIVEPLTESDFDITSSGYFGESTEADAITEANWMPIILLPGDPHVHFKMTFDTFVAFKFTIPTAGTYTFVHKTGTEVYPSSFSLAFNFFELNGDSLSPTYVSYFNFGSQQGAAKSYTFAAAGSYLICFDGDYQTTNNDDVQIILLSGDITTEPLYNMSLPIPNEQLHNNTAVRYSGIVRDSYFAVKVNITEAATYEFTLNTAELSAGTGDITGYLYSDSDKTTPVVAEVDDDSPDSNWEIFTYEVTTPGVYWVVCENIASATTSVDLTVENTTGTATGTLVGSAWAGDWVPEEGDEGRFIGATQTWDVSGAYRIGLMITELDSGSDDSEVKLWGDII